MAPDPSFYDSMSETDLRALLEKLSAPATGEEMAAGGLGGQTGPGNIDTWFQDPIKGSRNKGSILNRAEQASALQQFKWKQESKKQKAKQRAFAQAQLDAQDRFQQQRALQLDQVKAAIANAGRRSKINGAFSDASMGGLYDSIYDKVLRAKLNDVVDRYTTAGRNAGFQTAGQGLMGSSVDAERRGDVSQAQNAAAIGAAGEAQQFTHGVQQQNEEARQRLISTVSNPNPGTGAGYDTQIQGIVNQTRQLGDQFANQASQRGADQYGYDMQSQALGNLMTNLGKQYHYNQVSSGLDYAGSH